MSFEDENDPHRVYSSTRWFLAIVTNSISSSCATFASERHLTDHTDKLCPSATAHVQYDGITRKLKTEFEQLANVEQIVSKSGLVTYLVRTDSQVFRFKLQKTYNNQIPKPKTKQRRKLMSHDNDLGLGVAPMTVFLGYNMDKTNTFVISFTLTMYDLDGKLMFSRAISQLEQSFQTGVRVDEVTFVVSGTAMGMPETILNPKKIDTSFANQDKASEG